MSKLKPCLWPVDVPTDLQLSTVQGVASVVICAISGKTRMRFEDERMRSLMAAWDMTREQAEEHMHRDRMRRAELDKARGATEQDDAPPESELEQDDAQRARAFPTAATLRYMVAKLIYHDGDVDDSPDVSAELAECIDYDSETWLALQCLVRNRFVEESEAERGNASPPSSPTSTTRKAKPRARGNG